MVLNYSTLAFVSDNERKYKEYCQMIGIMDLTWLQIAVSELQEVSLESLAKEKIKIVRPKIQSNTPFFVEHTGLIINAWNGLPGGLTRPFMDTVGCEGICRMMHNFKNGERRARPRVTIGFLHPEGGVFTFHGDVTGIITEYPRGNNGFGWDPIFLPDNKTDTFGEMTQEEKNNISMRKSAAEQFVKYLDQHFKL